MNNEKPMNDEMLAAKTVTVVRMYAGQIAPLGPRRSPSGIYKQQLAPPWVITKTGLLGDHQGDLKVHGGPEKAIHQYPADHYQAWQRDFIGLRPYLEHAPAFGENLCLPEMTENNVNVGDVFRLGAALLQVSQGRQPCWKLNVKFDRPDMAAMVQRTGRTGWYYRILEEGRASPGDELKLEDRPHADWPLARLNLLLTSRSLARDELRSMAELRFLSASWRKIASRRLESGRIEDWSLRLRGATDN